MRHTDPNDLLDPVGPDPVLPPATPVEPTVPVDREVIPEDRRTVEPKSKFILIAVAIIGLFIWFMSNQ